MNRRKVAGSVSPSAAPAGGLIVSGGGLGPAPLWGCARDPPPGGDCGLWRCPDTGASPGPAMGPGTGPSTRPFHSPVPAVLQPFSVPSIIPSPSPALPRPSHTPGPLPSSGVPPGLWCLWRCSWKGLIPPLSRPATRPSLDLLQSPMTFSPCLSPFYPNFLLCSPGHHFSPKGLARADGPPTHLAQAQLGETPRWEER